MSNIRKYYPQPEGYITPSAPDDDKVPKPKGDQIISLRLTESDRIHLETIMYENRLQGRGSIAEAIRIALQNEFHRITKID